MPRENALFLKSTVSIRLAPEDDAHIIVLNKRNSILGYECLILSLPNILLVSLAKQPQQQTAVKLVGLDFETF